MFSPKYFGIFSIVVHAFLNQWAVLKTQKVVPFLGNPRASTDRANCNHCSYLLMQKKMSKNPNCWCQWSAISCYIPTLYSLLYHHLTTILPPFDHHFTTILVNEIRQNSPLLVETSSGRLLRWPGPRHRSGHDQGMIVPYLVQRFRRY